MCISQNRESIFEIIQHEIKIRWPFASPATVHELFMMMYLHTTYFRHTAELISNSSNSREFRYVDIV